MISSDAGFPANFGVHIAGVYCALDFFRAWAIVAKLDPVHSWQVIIRTR